MTPAPTAPAPMIRRHPRIVIAISICTLILGAWWFLFRPERHKHCIKAAMILLEYADEHDGHFPHSERGSADALIQLSTLIDSATWIPTFTGVDDDGSNFTQAIKTGEDLREEDCTRIYIQGLTTKSNPGIAILFDRFAVKGGDHFRGMPRQPLLREAYFIDGSHRMIKNPDWNEFAENQKLLLQQEGFTENEIEAIYGNLITD